ncbi:fungal-specific transcription factor domain-containing protein [Neurospora intermedia]|uniref:Fungal-specific transcription factor domain-containing protein n=1 Tax=Neurospora intermedia TaxID=5142 RepID=A0ABR3DCR7_NEUIN
MDPAGVKMLLYTRLAPPKEPKRRSRAGCTFCKEKKKKCDEGRPQCSRCVEHGATCVYEALRPRRRRKASLATSSSSTISSNDSHRLSLSRRLSDFGYDSDSASPPESTEVDYMFSPPDLHQSTYWNAPSPTPSYPLISPTESLFTLPDLSHAEERTEDAEDGGIAESWTTYTAVTAVLRPTPYYPDLAMIAPCPVTSPLFEFHSPAFSEFTDRPNRRALVDHFCNILSHLIVFREESGNPFQQLVLPLTRQSSPVLNAIFALASAHLEYRGIQNEEHSLFFHNQAIQGLGRLIEQSAKSNRNEILATIMLLIYYEVLVQRGRSNLVDGHLKGALTIMCTHSEPSDSTSIFLERAFRFYDVIAALSNGRAPLSAAPTAGCLMPFPPLGAPITSPLSNVDTLLGMATTLWPIIHRLSSIVTLKSDLQAAIWSNASASKIAVLRTELEATTQAIEAALSRWQPQLPPGFAPDEEVDQEANKTTSKVGSKHQNDRSKIDVMFPFTVAERSRLHSIWHNALAYRHSAFVYLYRSVHGYRRSHRAVQEHTHRSLLHCAATVKHEGPMGALLWPLFVAACEAVTEDDRGWAEQAFEKVKKRQGMRNIERAWEIVREVWKRADRAESVAGAGAGVDRGSKEQEKLGDMGTGEDLWRQVSREMGVSVVFG